MSGPAKASGASGAPMPGEGAKVVLEGAEPAYLSKEQIKAANVKPTPPSQKPGGALHQIGSRPQLLSRQLLPLYPLFAIVGVGVGLAGWHATRSLAWPGTDLFKGKRKNGLEMEMERGGEVEDRYQKYFQGSHLRHLAAQPGAVGAVRDFSSQPAVLPGDPKESADRTFSDRRAHVQG